MMKTSAPISAPTMTGVLFVEDALAGLSVVEGLLKVENGNDNEIGELARMR